MTTQRINELVAEFNNPTVTWQRANAIHILLADEAKAQSFGDDKDAYSLLIDKALIDKGNRRKPEHIIQLLPMIYQICGDRDGSLRLAEPQFVEPNKPFIYYYGDWTYLVIAPDQQTADETLIEMETDLNKEDLGSSINAHPEIDMIKLGTYII